jgi:hypothetical protein
MARRDPDDYRYGVIVRFFEQRVWAGEDDEPGRFVQAWEGRIYLEHCDGVGRSELIGSFSLRFLDLGRALNERVSYFDVFDTYQSTMDIFEALYDLESGELRREVAKLAFGQDCQFNEGLLVLDRLEILPKHRGHLAGLRVMKALIHQFRAGSGLVVLKPFPLQFEADEGPTVGVTSASLPRADLHLNDFTRSERVARSKLKKYYGRLGFVPVPRTDYMVLDPTCPLANIDAMDEESGTDDDGVPSHQKKPKLEIVRRGH